MTEQAHHVDAGTGHVHGWSLTRLQFEPVGAMKEYLTQLRAALSDLAARDGCGLVATYSAPDDALVDVENVLLYNVGSGAYSHLLTGGLDVRREQSEDARHHLDYQVSAVQALPRSPDTVIASVDAPIGSWRTVGDWWAGLRPAVQPGPASAPAVGTRFTVDVTLHGSWTGPRVAAAVKPMLDGLISALHSHDGSAEVGLRERLGDDTWERLNKGEVAVLGERRLVRPHGPSGVAWNPADDLCDGFVISPVEGDHRRLVATVHALPIQPAKVGT